MVYGMYILGHKDNYGFTLADFFSNVGKTDTCILIAFKTLYVIMLPYCFLCVLLKYFKFSKCRTYYLNLAKVYLFNCDLLLNVCKERETSVTFDFAV